MRRLPPGLRPLAEKAREAGWTIEPSRKGHHHWRDAEGRLRHVSSGSPGRKSGSVETRAQLRRAGLDV